MKQKLLLGLCLSNIFALALTAFFPSLKLFAYSPFIVLTITHLPFKNALWISFTIGAFLDFVSTTPMGIHALNFSLTTILLFRARKYFFDDHPYNLSLFTALFSLVSTSLYALLFFIFDRRVLLSGKWILTDLLFLPFVDGLYAYLWFTLPFHLWKKIQRKKDESIA